MMKPGLYLLHVLICFHTVQTVKGCMKQMLEGTCVQTNKNCMPYVDNNDAISPNIIFVLG